MKHVLLSTAALAGLAIAAIAPAAAAEGGLKLGVTGYYAGYAAYTKQDDAVVTDGRKIDFRKHVVLGFAGETTLENGLTVGAYASLLGDRGDINSGIAVEQSYAYFSGGWGRVNFGETDGAGILLQVAAPSADDEVDGLAPDINTLGVGTASAGYGMANVAGRYTNKLTYLTPVMNGFQAGVTFTPALAEADQQSGDVQTTAKDAGQYNAGYEVAGRYQGSFDAFDLTAGAGYLTANRENGGDSYKAYNAAAVATVGNVDAGVAYLHGNDYNLDGVSDDAGKKWVLGADYKIGAYKLGASYQTGKVNSDTSKSYTAGATYEFGPGMSFRGSISYGKDKISGVKTDGTQVAVGTVVNF